jgi:Protein of unknown function (DUF3300)
VGTLISRLQTPRFFSALKGRASMFHLKVRENVLALLALCLCVFCDVSNAQGVPTGDQLDQLLAPIALYPDALLAQICAASSDPQQIIDANNWLRQNANLTGQALTDAAQSQGFDPAFISLVSFPQVLDAMAAHVDDYAALGAAFKANQQSVMSAIQNLRQQAYASGALDSNEYQTVSVQQQNGVQAVVVQPANPQIVFVPQYQPEQVYVAGSSTGDFVAASLLSFGAGIAIGALINDSQPWGWGGWSWGWGGRGLMYRHSLWGFSYRYRSPRPYYRPRPPIYNRPIVARPPPNWNQRPGYRPPPPGWRPGRPNDRPGSGGARPPGNGGSRPPGNIGGGRPPGGGTRPPGDTAGTRPPTGEGRPPSNARPRPMPHNPYAGFPAGGTRPQASRPAPTPPATGARPGAFEGNNSGKSERAASDRGRASAGADHRAGGRRR